MYSFDFDMKYWSRNKFAKKLYYLFTKFSIKFCKQMKYWSRTKLLCKHRFILHNVFQITLLWESISIGKKN